MPVIGYEYCVLGDRLREKKMVEGIAVMHGQLTQFFEMHWLNSQKIECLGFKGADHLGYVRLQFSDPNFDDDFPKGNHTDQDVVPRIFNELARTLAQTPIIAEPP